jgi:hypothetical protein
MELSQKNILAIGGGGKVEFWENPFSSMTLYMQHTLSGGYEKRGVEKKRDSREGREKMIEERERILRGKGIYGD